jgi:protein TonB
MSRILRVPFFGSLSIHVALILSFLVFRSSRETPQAADTAPRVTARLYLPDFARPGGGDSGGGDRRVEPVRRAEARGADRVSVPGAPPPTFTPQPSPPDVELDAPIVSAVPAFADVDVARGLVDPGLPRAGGPGAGTNGVGNGRQGDGPGDGRRPGFGGDTPGVGNGVSAPVLVQQVRPQYTSAAMSARLAGSVVVECIVTPDGTVGDARVVRSLDTRFGLDEEALKAARQWRFRPGMFNGRPVAVRITIELTFSIY